MTGGVDPTIALRAGNIGAIAAGNQLNPLEAGRSIIDIQRGINEIRNNNAQFFAQKLGGEIASQYPDLQSGTLAALQDPSVAAFGGDWAKTRADMDHQMAAAGSERQSQALNQYHAFGQMLMPFGAALRRGASDEELDQLWNGATQGAMAASTDDQSKQHFIQGLTGLRTSIFAGTSGLTGQARTNKMYANFINTLPAAGVTPDMLEEFQGPKVLIDQGNVTGIYRAPPGGSMYKIGEAAMGLPPARATGPTGLTYVQPAVSGAPGGPGIAPGQTVTPPQGGEFPMEITGQPNYGGAMSNLVGVDQPTVGAPPMGTGPGGLGGAATPPAVPPPGPAVPPPAVPPPAAPATSGPATPGFHGTEGGRVDPGQPMPKGAEAVDYAPPWARQATVVPNTNDHGSPLAGDNKPLFSGTGEDMPPQRIVGTDMQAADVEAAKEHSSDLNEIPEARQVMGQIGQMNQDLYTIARSTGATKLLTELGPLNETTGMVGQLLNQFDSFVGAHPEVDPRTLAALQEYVKMSQQLTLTATRLSLGQSHVAAESINRVNQTVAGGRNSVLGAMAVNGINQATVQRFMDKTNWDTEYLNRHHYLYGSSTAFDQNHQLKDYYTEASRQLGMQPDMTFKGEQGRQALRNLGNALGPTSYKFIGDNMKKFYPED